MSITLLRLPLPVLLEVNFLYHVSPFSVSLLLLLEWKHPTEKLKNTEMIPSAMSLWNDSMSLWSMKRGSHLFRSLSNPQQWVQFLTIAIEFICQLITQLITGQLWLTASPLLFRSPCITITLAEPFVISQARAAPDGSLASYTQALLILDLPEFCFFQNLPGPLFPTECNLVVLFVCLLK